MKTLVIHPKDESTSFLSKIYEGENWTLLSENVSKSLLRKQIISHERIIMLGHGSEGGLFGFGRFVIDSGFVQHLRGKIIVAIWCKSNVFVEKYSLKGHYTGMIISEWPEAVMYCIRATDKEIKESNILFSTSIRDSLKEIDFVKKVLETYKGSSDIIAFNRLSIHSNI